MNFYKEVSILQDSDIARRVESCVSLLGGMEKFVGPGDTVFIKPNLVYAEPPPYTTDLATIKALVTMAKRAGARSVFVGDAPSSAERQAKGLTLRAVLEKIPLAQAVEGAGGTICYLDENEVADVNIPDSLIYRKAKIYKPILDCDKIITVPVLKTHFLTDVTLGIKCLYGAVGLEDRKKFHRDDLHQKLVDLLSLLRPCLTVIDASIAMEGFGPKAGSAVKMNVTLAGSDVVATDSVACHLIGVDPMKVDHIRIAHSKGFGEANLHKIKVLGDPLQKLHRDFKIPDLRLGGIYEWAEVVEGGLCRECRGRSRWLLDEVNLLGFSNQKKRKITLITGIDPFLPDPSDQRLTVLIGDCTLRKARSLNGFLKSKNVMFVEGCPPATAPRILPSKIMAWLKEAG